MQRVRWARIRVGDEIVGEMGFGLLALVAAREGEGEGAADELAEKLVHLRIFADADGRMNRSLLDVRGELGVVSQFTLYGDARKGRRPSFQSAARPEAAEPLLERVAHAARALGVSVVTGRFRAAMEVELSNDGPVTLLIDTDKIF